MLKSIAATVFTSLVAFSASATQIEWAGYHWTVREGTGDPGPNNWSTKNVWVDKDGCLNLRVTKQSDGSVTTAAVVSSEIFKNGTYTWQVDGPLKEFDQNVVLGLFQYPSDLPQGTHEIDIEIGRWGNPKQPDLNYTVWPPDKDMGVRNWTTSRELQQALSYTFSYRRDGGAVHYDTFNINTASHKPMPVKMNLWLMNGARTYKRDYVVRIKSFVFTPAGN